MSRSDFKQFAQRDFAFRNSKGKEKQPPVLPAGVPVADTHVHLNMLPDPALAIARAAHHGLRFLCCITDPAERAGSAGEDSTFLSAADSYAAAAEWLEGAREILDGLGEPDTPLPQLRFACGVHPHNARLWEDAREQLLSLLHDPQTCCLGEIGLDYHYDFSPRQVQREVFVLQLQIAHEAGLPVSLHLREAHADALEILREQGVPQAGCILHCFNLDARELAPFAQLGCHIAFGGPLTFRKSWYTRLASLNVAPNRLLTETDAPYMAPEPLRGTECEPAQTIFTLRMLLDCFGYAGQDRALEVLQPRPVDIANGEVPPTREELAVLDEVQADYGEAAFAQRVYANAVELLDRQPTAWQQGQPSAGDMAGTESVPEGEAETGNADQRPDLDALILVGSPHMEGKSTALAHAVEEELVRRGVKPTFYHLAQYPVAACNNCGACTATGQCRIVNDPWGVLSRHMDSADVLFLVAPVYFAGPSGWLKAALDRCQVYWARKYVLHADVPPRRPAHLLVVGDGGDPFGTQPLETICTSALNCANLRIADQRTHRFIGDDYALERVPGIVEAALQEVCG